MRRYIVGLGLILVSLASASADASRVVDVANGDSARLIEEVGAAFQRSGQTTIRLAPNGTYEITRPLIPYDRAHETISSQLVLRGQGSRIVLKSAVQEMIFLRPEDALTLSDSRLSVQSPASVNDSPRTFVVFDLRGHTYWENVSVTDSRITTFTLATMFLLGYQGNAPIVWRNVSVVGNEMKGRSAEPLKLAFALANNQVTFESVTFADNVARNESGATRQLGLGDVQSSDPQPSPIRVTNSLIDHCVAPVNSLGGNAFLDSRCGAGAQDRLLSDAQLGSMDDHGGLVPTLALLPSSQAIGAGLPATCPATDARGFVRDAQRCDAGAYQFGAAGAGGKLDAGGANGTWIDLGGSGFLLVNRNTDEETLLVWLSYDRQRRQRWIYGVLNFADGQASGTAWNNDGPPSTGGYPDARVAGTFTATFISCEQTRLRFDSSSAELESFDRVLNRLSLVTQVGCSE
jgi:hypothetical protein